MVETNLEKPLCISPLIQLMVPMHPSNSNQKSPHSFIPQSITVYVQSILLFFSLIFCISLVWTFLLDWTIAGTTISAWNSSSLLHYCLTMFLIVLYTICICSLCYLTKPSLLVIKLGTVIPVPSFSVTFHHLKDKT